MRTVELGECHSLPAILTKIRRIEPALEICLSERPFGIEHGEPCRVPVSPLDDHVLPENPLEAETQAQRGPPRRGIESVALPFVAAIAQFVEHMPRQQIH